MNTPALPFTPPPAYTWLVGQGLVGFEPFSALQPWHFLPPEQVFSVTDRWPVHHAGSQQIFAFARRQDCDDLACLVFEANLLIGVMTVHGWTPEGYDVLARHGSVWDWLKSAIDDVREWAEANAA